MYTRSLETRLRSALADTPVVLIHGARQVGKTTLAQAVGEGNREAFSLDRTPVLTAAVSDPDGFIAGLTGPVFIDEIQRAPGLFPAIKHAVDRDRTPGRFLLTGSANVLALPTLSESLAGRMEICTLWPLTQAELQGAKSNFVDVLFDDGKLRSREDGPSDLWERVLRGGYPEAVSRKQADRRQSWFESYVNTILQRDVRDLSNIDKLAEMPRLLQLLAARSSGLLNFADIANSLSLGQTTTKRYIALLEAVFLVRMLPAWTSNLSSRVIKSPKVHLLDSGLASALLGVDRKRLDSDGSLRGQLLETFVAMELVKLAGTSTARPKPHHFRTTNGREVDVVLEAADGRIVGIEVKASASIDTSAFRGIETLREASGDRMHRGIVLYGGDQVVPFGNGLWAVPISSLWA